MLYSNILFNHLTLKFCEEPYIVLLTHGQYKYFHLEHHQSRIPQYIRNEIPNMCFSFELLWHMKIIYFHFKYSIPSAIQ